MSLSDEIEKLIRTKRFSEFNGHTIEEELTIQADYLASLIRKHLARERAMFIPTMYKRTNKIMDSIYTDPTITCTINRSTYTFNISVRFLDEYVMRPSNYGANLPIYDIYDDVNVAYLLNYGYRVRKKVPFRNVWMLGVRPAWHYIENAIEEFNYSNSLGIILTKDNIIFE